MGAVCQKRSREGFQNQVVEGDVPHRLAAEREEASRVPNHVPKHREAKIRSVSSATGRAVIVADRSDGANLGVQCEPLESSLLIHGVMESGLVAAWNETNPECPVTAGDRIVEVNGIRGRSELLISELKQATRHVIHLERAQARPGSTSSKSVALDQTQADQQQAQSECSVPSLHAEVCLDVASHEESMATASGGDGADAIEIDISLDKTNGTSLGVTAKPADNVLIIEQVNGGLVEKWNEDNPEYQVQHGDRIVEINGCRGDINELIGQCKQNHLLRIKLLRDAGPSSQPCNKDDSICVPSTSYAVEATENV